MTDIQRNEDMPFRNIIILVLATILVGFDTAGAKAENAHFDVVIFGATPGGIAAAVSAARRDPDLKIALLSPYRRIGGMIANGLNHPDFRTFEARTGLYRELNQRVEKHFRETFPEDPNVVEDSLSGTHAGPEVNYRRLRAMVDEQPGITVLTGHRRPSAWLIRHQRCTQAKQSADRRPRK
ncbi:MAG: FAD-dependent oxidoreductase, partial [Planctomycetota bacterium]